MSQQTKWSQFGVLISVFFFWGFVAASNDILIPVFKEKLNLEQWQSQMISFAFYVAYTIGALLYLLISKTIGGDILNKIGYKNGIAIGLIISALGTLLFIPAANSASFVWLIIGLFIVGLGFSLQQTAANPLAIVMGDPKTGAQRLSLAGGVNNLGTTIGPVLVNLAIFGSITGAASVASISSVQVPYIVLGIAFVLAAVVFKFSNVPNKVNLGGTKTADSEHSEFETEHITAVKPPADLGAPTKYPQLVMGMIGIFVYVGVEVSTAANLPEFMKQHLGTPTDRIAPFVSLFWASLMIGRWTAATAVFGLKGGARTLMNILMPYIAFGVFLLINKIANHDITPFYIYAAIIVVMIIGDFLSRGNPARQLLIFSVMGITALITGMLSDGMVSVYAFISVGLFCSTLWPCIFTLSIAGLGKHTNEGANLLIMMIMGGGVISLLQGYLAGDNLLGIQYSYIVGVACFAYLAFYAIRGKAILKKQGIDYDKLDAAGGH